MANTNSASAPVVEEVKERIELTQIERSIFDRLLATLRHFGLTNHHLRVAGGWVRDKLLGKDCYDIDIALDNMLGSEFVDKVRDYLLSTGEQVQGVAFIPCNPEQSKHLETARMRLFDMWIDFVNLRSEEYSDNSLIPTKQKFGTAEEDAYRRDLTINSLFYNINTILPPKFEPAKSEGCDRFCIGYLDATWSLIQLIGDSTFNDEQRRLSLYAALFLPFRKTIYKDNKAKKIPIVNYIFRESLKRKASDAETKYNSLVTISFLLSVVNLPSALDKFLSLIPFLVSDGNVQPIEVNWGRGLDDVPLTSKLRVLTGLLLREIKDFWRVTLLLLSTLLYPTEVDCTEDFPKQHFQLDKQRDLFEAVESAIAKLGLEKVWDVKPLVNGKDIMSVLQLKAGGPLIRVWQQNCLRGNLPIPMELRRNALIG